MDGGVDRASGQRLLELLYKEALAADVGERRRRELVAAGPNLDNFNLDTGDLGRELRANDRRLRQRQLAWPRADSYFQRPNP
jgi:hypothetical protein